MNKFKVGDNVRWNYDFDFEPGKIIEIKDNDDYTIKWRDHGVVLSGYVSRQLIKCIDKPKYLNNE